MLGLHVGGFGLIGFKSEAFPARYFRHRSEHRGD